MTSFVSAKYDSGGSQVIEPNVLNLPAGGGGGGGGSAADDIAFNTTVPLLNTAGTYMTGIQAVSGALTFVPAPNPVRGAYAFATLKANGTNVPDVSAFTEHGSSMGYLNTPNIINIAQFFYLGGTAWVSWSQAAVPVAVVSPTTVSLSGPTAGVINTDTTAYTVGTDGVRPLAVVVTPTPVAGVTFTPSSVTLPAGSATATFVANSSSTGNKTIAVTNNSGLTNPAAITLAVAAAATVPVAPTIGVAVLGDTTATFPFTLNGTGGSAITSTRVKVYKTSDDTLVGTFTGASNATSIQATGLTNGVSVYGKAEAINNIGPSAQSAASNNVIPASASSGNLRLTSLNMLTESGTGPWSYAYPGGGSTSYGNQGGISTLSRPASTDAAAQITATADGELIFGVTQAGNAGFANMDYGVFWNPGQPYTQIVAGTVGASTGVAHASGDTVRESFVGTTLVIEVARAGSPTTFIPVVTFTGVSAAARKFAVNINANCTGFTGGVTVGLA